MVDVNPNPLRNELVPLPDLDALGRFTPPAGAGLAVDPEPAPWLEAEIEVA